jgi:DUF4097 and DUF4098 domain-containing protein YvlB
MLSTKKENISMNAYCTIIGRIVLINLFFCQVCTAKSIFEPLWAYWRPSYEQASIKELKIPAQGTVCVKNTEGDIAIKEWNQNTIQLKTTKRAFKNELLAQTQVITTLNETTLTLATQRDTADQTTSVNYELIIPQHTKVKVSTETGSINIEKINGTVHAITGNGTITLYDIVGSIDATTQTGNIIIKNSQGSIRAETNTGDISIQGARHTIVAKTQNGKITTECTNVPSLDTILLTTQTGDINLTVPQTTNADLQAHTHKGVLTCEQFVTTKPQTMQLNKKTWARVKKEVTGTLGTGEATIKLSANSGDIRIS